MNGIPDTSTLHHRYSQAAAHAANPAYGTKGYRFSDDVLALLDTVGGSSVLDYGCGKGTLRPALLAQRPEFEVAEFDPGIPGKDRQPPAADVVACFDVLIFVEPDRVDAVLDHIAALARKAVLLNVPDHPRDKLDPKANLWFLEHDFRWWIGKFLARWPGGQAWVREPASPRNTRYLFFKGFTS